MAGGQIDGLVSNLNTTGIVESIMAYERITIDRLEASKLEKTNKMTVFNSITAKLVALKTKAAQLSRLATFDSAKVAVSDEDFVTAAINGSISEGQYNISIDQLALNHQIASQGFESESASIGTGTFTITVGNGSAKDITITSANSTLSGLKDAINDAKAGVKAAIISDGSDSKSYRLVLTSDETGRSNTISITSGLSGGISPDFSSSSFDDPEYSGLNSASDFEVSLGSSAAYSGSSNKTYAFTVQGTGTQTIGTDAVTVNWSDGTNSGSIEIPADYVAGTEIALTGTGADGLTVSFSAGAITAGDTFKVQTFSPLLQAAQDAKISLGSTDNGGSPIEITSSNNIMKNVIPGVTLNLNKVTNQETSTINISTSVDIDDITAKINEFISSYNDVMTAIGEQFKYSEESTDIGLLFGDSTLRSIQTRLRSVSLLKMEEVDGGVQLLSQLGIRHNSKGQLQIMDPSSLSEALQDNLAEVVKFFTNSANSTNGKISYVGATSNTEVPDDGFEVKIIQAATTGYLQGASLADPAITPLKLDENNHNIKLRVDGLVSEDIALTQKTYNSFEELVTELQTRIDQDANLGGRDISVEYVDLGGTGYIKINSATYGSTSKVEIQAGVEDSALKILGLSEGRVVTGEDVKGTINGEAAEGRGQILTGADGNYYSDGLSLKVELTESDLSNSNSSATLTFMKGFATQVDELLDMYTATGEGVIAGRTNALQFQIDNIDSWIEREEERMEIREARLYQQYYALEKTLAEWNSTGSFLESQIANIESNWSYSRGGN